MNRRKVAFFALTAALGSLAGCGDRPGSAPEVPAEELAARVPLLDSIHAVMHPMWHEAYPAKDYTAIAEAVSRFEPLMAALDTVRLPSILQDKQARWDEQKTLLKSTFEGLKAAVEAGSAEQMLAFTEAFHMNYEGMVRIIRPVVPELEAFHQQLYALYHYYGPAYDLEKIRAAADSMAAVIPNLKAAQLPARLADLQGNFEGAVQILELRVSELRSTLENPSREAVQAAIEAVHDAYHGVEEIFG